MSGVRYEQDGRVVVLTLDEPDTRNAISPAIVQGIEDACTRINKDMGVSCLVITGAGKSFSSGGNVKDMARFAEPGIDADAIRNEYRHGIQRIPRAMWALDVPVIAAVNGPAIGAGLDLACMCDIRIASDAATFAESFEIGRAHV